jgi:hypothetical protein
MNHATDGEGVRLVTAAPDRLDMAIDRARDADEVIEQDGEPLLIVDACFAGRLSHAKMDCVTVVMGYSSRTDFILRPFF